MSRHDAVQPLIALERAELILRLALEVACVVSFVQLLVWFSPGPIHHLPSLHGRSLGNILGPADNVLIAVSFEKLCRLVGLVGNNGIVPRPDSHVGDGVVIARYIVEWRADDPARRVAA